MNTPVSPSNGKKRASVGAPRPTAVNDAALGPLRVTKWRFDNGLQAILLPDPAATSVAYLTWFRVGSRHEQTGDTGLAHLFEHLMFTQTKGANNRGDFDTRMEEVGANSNAMTYYDFTAYIDNVPPDALPLAVELEADRMTNLALGDKQVQIERNVVIEERLSSVEDSVDGLLDEILYRQAFRNHPYRFPVIGLMEDIKGITTAKAMRFYKTHYAPNNAVIVVAGRFDPDAVLTSIADHYGALPASDRLPVDEIKPERAPIAESRSEIVRPVPADRFVVGYAAPALGDADRAAYEVLDQILTAGPSSRLYQRLVVDAAIASSVHGDVAATKDPGLYALWVQMVKGHEAAAAQAVIDEEIARLLARPVGAPDLAKAKNHLETAFWAGLASSEGKAEHLGQFEISAGDYRTLLGRADEYARVTGEDVLRVARKYLGTPARSLVIAKSRDTPKPRDPS